MSRQINLLNLTLLPRRDWLTLALLVGVVVLIVVAESAFYLQAKISGKAMEHELALLVDESKRLQEQVTVLSKTLGEQKTDPQLQAKVEQRAEQVRESEEVLAALKGQHGNSGGFSAYFNGFARQTMNGLWLTEFSLSGEGLAIKGRMLDVALLPVYIRRLNADPGLQGRNFSALDMKAVESLPAPAAGSAESKDKPPPLPAYTEFSLQGSVVAEVRK